jgi:hypothetical protein
MIPTQGEFGSDIPAGDGKLKNLFLRCRESAVVFLYRNQITNTSAYMKPKLHRFIRCANLCQTDLYKKKSKNLSQCHVPLSDLDIKYPQQHVENNLSHFFSILLKKIMFFYIFGLMNLI